MPIAEIEQEQKLVERAKHDSEAFGELYDLYYSRIFNYALRRMADVSAAEDVTAEVFIKALGRIQRFTWRGVPFSAWLYRIASNEIADHFRDRHAKNASLEVMMGTYGFEPESDIDIEASYIAQQKNIERHKQFLLIQQALLKLPAKYQEVLALRYFEKKSIAQIGLITGKRPGTIKSLLSRGTKKLRETVPSAR